MIDKKSKVKDSENPLNNDFAESLILETTFAQTTAEAELEKVLLELGGFGRFQRIFCFCLIFIFVLGSQFFYSFPFY